MKINLGFQWMKNSYRILSHLLLSIVVTILILSCNVWGPFNNPYDPTGTNYHGNKAIITFSFPALAATGIINLTSNTIAATVPNGTNVTTLVATFTTTGASVKVGSLVQISGITVNTFTNPLVYTVTAADGSTANYTVTVSLASGTYSVTYNANGGLGIPPIDNTNYHQSDSVIVSGAGGLVYTGFNLAGWMTNSDGTGTSYATGATLTMATANITLYAVWIQNNIVFSSSGTSITITSVTSAPFGNVVIPNGVTNIGSSIGSSPFSGCNTIISFSVPASVTGNPGASFAGCNGLTSINVNSSNPNYESISGILFNKTETTIIEVPGGLTGSYSIPGTVTTVGDWAFLSCYLLTTVTIPSSVTSINSSGFQNCIGLTSIIIPSNVDNIGQEAFGFCSNLSSITVQATMPATMPASGYEFSGCAAGLQIHVPTISYTAYQTATGWSDYISIIVTP
jgi:hypothetical protein